MNCQLCKKAVDLPFRCNYCGQYFCAEHRLPEQHLCPNLQKKGWRGRSIASPSRTTTKKSPSQPQRTPQPTYPARRVSKYRSPRPSRPINLTRSLFYFAIIAGIAAFAIYALQQARTEATFDKKDINTFYRGKASALISTVKCWGWIYGIYGIIPFVIPIIPLTTEYSVALVTQFLVFVLIFALSCFGLIKLGASELNKGILNKLLVIFTLLVILSPIIVPMVFLEYERHGTDDFRSRDELRTFLKNDITDSMIYTDDFVCEDFSRMLIKNAREAGYRMYFLQIRVKNPSQFQLPGEDYVGHALCRAYIISEDKWIEVEPQTDVIDPEW